MRVTPPFGVTGLWTLREPFYAKPSVHYTCVAIRSFVELELMGYDVAKLVYNAKELDNSVHQADAAEYATLVTLIAPSGEMIHVPDTYIVKYPDMNGSNFVRFVLSCELGALPEETDTAHIVDKVKTAVHHALGRVPTVNVHTAAFMSEELTPSELVREENNRKNSVTDRTTSQGKLAQIMKNYSQLQEYTALLENRIRESNEKNGENNRLLEQLKLDKQSLTEEVNNLRDEMANSRNEQITNYAQYQDRIRTLEDRLLAMGGSIT